MAVRYPHVKFYVIEDTIEEFVSSLEQLMMNMLPKYRVRIFSSIIYKTRFYHFCIAADICGPIEASFACLYLLPLNWNYIVR